MSTLICAPDGYKATKSPAPASKALRYLLAAYPNQVITHRDVCEVLGYGVGPSAVSNAAARLRQGPFGLAIETRSGTHGGYVLLVPVPARDGHCCGACKHRSLIDTCTRMKGRPVERSETCWGWE